MPGENENTVESLAPVEVQREAEAMGWIPPTRFKGDPERFVDADVYIRRGQEVLPIVREHNKRLQGQLSSVQAQLAAQNSALKAAQDAISQMELRHSVETQRAVEAARDQVKKQLEEAHAAGDSAGVAELTDQLTKLREVEREAPKPAETPAQQETAKAYVPPQDLVDWNAENPWFGADRRKTALAITIAEELRQGGETAQGRDFFDKVKAELEQELGLGKSTPAEDKVAGNAGRGGSTAAVGRGKGYASMPADARTACDADAKRFVGPGKRFQKVEDWRSQYAEMYFGG